MVDVDGGTFVEREQFCHYREVHFILEVMEVSEVSREQTDGIPVIEAKWCPRMKVKVV